MTQRARKRFDQVFAESVVRALSGILGESCGQALLYYMERTAWQKEPLNPEVLSEFLGRTFGWGARVIERRILEVMYSELGSTFAEREGYKFADYVNECRGAEVLTKK